MPAQGASGSGDRAGPMELDSEHVAGHRSLADMPLAFLQQLVTCIRATSPATLATLFRCCRQLAELVAAHAPNGARLVRHHGLAWPQALTDVVRWGVPWRELEVVLLPGYPKNPTAAMAQHTCDNDDDNGIVPSLPLPPPLMPRSLSVMVTRLHLCRLVLAPGDLVSSCLLLLPSLTATTTTTTAAAAASVAPAAALQLVAASASCGSQLDATSAVSAHPWPVLRLLDLDNCQFVQPLPGAAPTLPSASSSSSCLQHAAPPQLCTLRVSAAAAASGLPSWAEQWLLSLAAGGVTALHLRGVWRGASCLVEGLPRLEILQWSEHDADGGTGATSACYSPYQEHDAVWTAMLSHGALRHVALSGVDVLGDYRGARGGGGVAWETLTLERCGLQSLLRLPVWRRVRTVVLRGEVDMVPGSLPLPPYAPSTPPLWAAGGLDGGGFGPEQHHDDGPMHVEDVSVAELLWMLQRAGRLAVEPAPASAFAEAAWCFHTSTTTCPPGSAAGKGALSGTGSPQFAAEAQQLLFLVNATPDPSSAEQQFLPSVLSALAAAQWRSPQHQQQQQGDSARGGATGEAATGAGGTLGLVLQHPSIELLAPLSEALAALGDRARTLCLCVDCWGWNRFLNGLVAALPPTCKHLKLHLPFGALMRPARSVLQSTPPSHALTVTVMDHFDRLTAEEEQELVAARACGGGAARVTLRFHRRRRAHLLP